MAAALLHRPGSCSSMSRPAAPTPLHAANSGSESRRSPLNGVTVIMTTHFMPEAEYRDRAAILDSGKVLAQGTPAELRGSTPSGAASATIEDAFVAIVAEGARRAGDPRRGRGHDGMAGKIAANSRSDPSSKPGRFCAIRAVSRSASCFR